MSWYLFSTASFRRFRIAKIIHKDDTKSVKKKLEVLGRFFRRGKFFESFEKQTEISTFHIEECERELNAPEIEDNDFEASVCFFQEMECMRSESSVDSLQEKCFIISGFSVPDEDCYKYFTSNWREVSGLGNILTYLAPNYFVNNVRFLVNNNFAAKSNHFLFMTILEVYFPTCQLINLLDFVQKFRVERNVGFISLYAEFKLCTVKSDDDNSVE